METFIIRFPMRETISTLLVGACGFE